MQSSNSARIVDSLQRFRHASQKTNQLRSGTAQSRCGSTNVGLLRVNSIQSFGDE